MLALLELALRTLTGLLVGALLVLPLFLKDPVRIAPAWTAAPATCRTCGGVLPTPEDYAADLTRAQVIQLFFN